MKLSSVALSLLLFTCICSASPPWYSPPKGSAERAQIMAALRAKLSTYDPASHDLVFVVKELCVSASAGWLAVEPQSRNGQNRLEPFQASLKRSKSRWVVDTLACGEEDCAKGTDPNALRARVDPSCE